MSIGANAYWYARWVGAAAREIRTLMTVGANAGWHKTRARLKPAHGPRRVDYLIRATATGAATAWPICRAKLWVTHS